MQLFVRGFDAVEPVEVLPTATIAEVKAQIAQTYGLNTEEITLNCEGNALCNDAAVTSLASFELDITVPMLGGKVHGSLARAGKVKGQTPKVEKQEKKKKKTGRAKRRIQYNRRFVNIVQGFGRRRGPNANSN
ncbi:FAU ubiquitin-like and ribosomal protein S30 [Bactrocera neohumeralis]|uniref:FAU ubiquitin-like and ribosomal protein S30 n=1 Tax=Bactrocera dorsalis TaxID=27457 RepID=A0A6I9VPK5_BACDO|nr:FAU ubiquitin-like and ribosomal protein S30 [Bactrocera dorsalis]XP_050317716.1 FAU ubiquitin-like and ribosomal protein S30 [Bactrocera neohumeralis]